MTRNEITNKARQRIDEVGVNETISLNFPIDIFINESANQAYFDAPISYADNIVDFKDQTLIANSDGSGEIELPDLFVRLVEFKMDGWHYSITTPLPYSSSIMKRESNIMLRGNPSRPVAVLSNDKLLYFSVDADSDHKVSIAKAQVYKKSFTSFSDSLADAISWLVASKSLQIMNEDALSKLAQQQYISLITNLNKQS